MNSYVKHYSIFGIQEMIKERKVDIEKKKKEREDVGLTWTSKHIESHKKTIDKEIISLEKNITELEEALKIKEQLQDTNNL